MSNINKIIFGVIVLIIVLIAISFLYIYNPSLFNKSSVPKIATAPTVEQSKVVLQAQMNFSIPDSSASTLSKISDLDKFVNSFIVPGALQVVVNKVLYTDGTKGITIVYDLGKNILDTYTDLLKPAKSYPFKVSAASRANLASLITTESQNYRVEITSEKLDEVSTKVTIKVQNK